MPNIIKPIADKRPKLTMKPSHGAQTAMFKVWMSFSDLGIGQFDHESLALIQTRLILGKELAKNYFTAPAYEAIDDAILNVRLLHEQTSKYVSHGKLEMIRMALEAVDDMIHATTEAERRLIKISAVEGILNEYRYHQHH